jgi:mannose/cellobiose epimerase-like protein (N-acyl-D-glucosamine 2-epimerase family)
LNQSDQSAQSDQPDHSPTNPEAVAAMSAEEQAEEQRLLRRLQMMMNLVMQTIAQDSSLSIDEASQMIADSRKAALAMFPGKELAYDLIWRPRFQRLMRERFRIM